MPLDSYFHVDRFKIFLKQQTVPWEGKYTPDTFYVIHNI